MEIVLVPDDVNFCDMVLVILITLAFFHLKFVLNKWV